MTPIQQAIEKWTDKLSVLQQDEIYCTEMRDNPLNEDIRLYFVRDLLAARSKIKLVKEFLADLSDLADL